MTWAVFGWSETRCAVSLWTIRWGFTVHSGNSLAGRTERAEYHHHHSNGYKNHVSQKSDQGRWCILGRAGDQTQILVVPQWKETDTWSLLEITLSVLGLWGRIQTRVAQIGWTGGFGGSLCKRQTTVRGKLCEVNMTVLVFKYNRKSVFVVWPNTVQGCHYRFYKSPWICVVVYLSSVENLWVFETKKSNIPGEALSERQKIPGLLEEETENYSLMYAICLCTQFNCIQQ